MSDIQQTRNICIAFVQRRLKVFDVGTTLYKCFTNVLCLLGGTRMRGLFEHLRLIRCFNVFVWSLSEKPLFFSGMGCYIIES